MSETVYREDRNYVRKPNDASDVYSDAPRIIDHHEVDPRFRESRMPPPPPPPPLIINPDSDEFDGRNASVQKLGAEDRTSAMKNGDIHSKPVPRSSKLRSVTWDADDGRVRTRYEELQRPSKSVPRVWYADDDTYDRAQEVSVPAIHTEVPVHMRNPVQNQMVSVRPRTQASGPIDFNENGDAAIVRRPDKGVSTSLNPNHRHVVYREVEKEAPRVQPEPEHSPGLFQTIFDVDHPRDATTHLELLITDDFEAELEAFSQLQRLGNFGAARDYFEKNLETYLSNPYVFVQYGQMLLDQGDYRAFERLNPEVVFGKDCRPTPWAPQTLEGWNVNLSNPRTSSQSRGRAMSASRYEGRKVYLDDASRHDMIPSSSRIPPANYYARPREEEIISERRTLPRRRDTRHSEAEPHTLHQQDGVIVEAVERTRTHPRSPSGRSPVIREVITTRPRTSSWSPIPWHQHPETRGRDLPPPRRARFESGVRYGTERHRTRSWSWESMETDYDSDLDDESYRNSSPDIELLVQDSEEQSDQGELELLRQNWRLLQATSTIHRNGGYEDACKEAWYTIENFQFGAKIGSTEIQIVVLVLQVCAEIGYVLPEWYYTDGLQEAAVKWVDWPALFKALLVEGRIWDFKDLHVALVAAFSDSADKILFGTRDIKSSLNYDWLLDDNDESTNLAQLSLFVEPTWVRSWYKDEAQSRAEAIILHFPTAMKSRPFIRWIMWDAADALFSISEEQNRDPPLVAETSRLQEFPGMVWIGQQTNNTSAYVPRNNENPGWFAPVTSPEVEEQFQLALNLAKELKDYKSQANCYKRLIRQSEDPTELFQELAHLQNDIQGDKRGHLETLLPRYLLCKGRPAQEKLFEELQRTGDQGDATTLWARDFIERAVKRTLEGPKSTARLRKPASFYMNLGLPREVEYFIWQNADHNPPSSRQEPSSVSHMRYGPVPLPRRSGEVQGQKEIRPLSKLRSHNPARRHGPRPHSQQQLPTNIRDDERDLTRALQTEAFERDRNLYERHRQTEREFREPLQQIEQSLKHRTEQTRRSEDPYHQDHPTGRNSNDHDRDMAQWNLVRTGGSETASTGDGDDVFGNASHERRSPNREVTSSLAVEQTEQQSDRIKESSIEEPRRQSRRDRDGHGDRIDIKSPQPSSRNALIVYDQAPGSFDSYRSGDTLRMPSSALPQSMDDRINFEGYAILTTGPEGIPTLERTTVYFQDRNEVSSSETERARDQPVSEPGGNTGKVGERDPLILREAGSRDFEEPEDMGSTDELGDRSLPNFGGAGSRDHIKAKDSAEPPHTYRDGSTGVVSDRDPHHVCKGERYDQYFDNSAQDPRSRPGTHRGSDDNHGSGRRLSASPERRAIPKLVSLNKDHTFYRAEGTEDQADNKTQTPGETGEHHLSKPLIAGSQENDELHFKKQSEPVADRPPKILTDSPRLQRESDEWDKITAKEREKQSRDRWNDIQNTKAHMNVVADPSLDITRTAATRFRTDPPPAPEHDEIQPLERRQSWREKRSTTSNRKQPGSASRASSLVFDADGRPQPSRPASDNHRAWVSEASGGSHKRRDSVDGSHMLPDTVYRTAIERPKRPLISRSQSTEETGPRLRRMGPESSVSERPPAENWKKEKDRFSKRKETMSALPEDPDEVAQIVAPQQQSEAKAEESSRLQVSGDPEPGISRKSTVADPEPGEE